MIKRPISSFWFIALVAAWFVVALNGAFWRAVFARLELTSASVIFAAASLPVVLWLLLVAALGILVWPRVGKPVVAGALVVSAVASYMMWSYGVYIDSDMIANVFQTDAREALDLLTPSAAVWTLLLGVAPAVLVCRAEIRYARPWAEVKRRLALVPLCLIAAVALVGLSYKEISSFGRNNSEIRKLINPSCYFYATFRYFQYRFAAKREFQLLDPEAMRVPSKDSAHTVFVMVVGETARAANFGLSGYARDTTPRLASLPVVNFTRVMSCGTATAISLPCIFSSKSRKDFDAADAAYVENLVDLLKNSGYQVWWRENDGGCKGVCDRAPTEEVVKTADPRFCHGDYCWDGALLAGLEDYIRAVKQDTLIVLHTMGSHGPTYYKRYPPEFAKFSPACNTADIQDCTNEEIVNTYDNTIAYTDSIVAGAIEILQKFPQFESGLLYVSDHGESLGENGIYLHGFPYAIAPEVQKHVPMVLWLSEKMKKYDRIDYACLKRRAASGEYSHDNLFHSLLSLLKIKSKMYKPEMDLFLPCRTGGYASAGAE